MAAARSWTAALVALALWAAGGPASAETPPDIQPALKSGKRHGRDAALVISNEAYAALPQVTWAGEDARAFLGWLRSSRGVSKWRIRTVTDGSAATMVREARRARGRVKWGGTLWVYYAGHGTVDAAGQRILVGIDAQGTAIEDRALRLKTLLGSLERTRRAKRIVVVLDAGFGNVARDGLELVPGRSLAKSRPLADLQGDRTLVWAATSGAEQAPAFEPAKHGLFTWTVLGALRGWADGELSEGPDGHVTVGEAQAYAERVNRQLGFLTRPSLDAGVDHGVWVLTQGRHLEAGPSAELLDALGDQEIRRRVEVAESVVRADAGAFWQDTLAIASQGGPEGREALEAYIREFSGARASVTWAVHVPEVAEARRVLLNYNEEGPPPSAEALAVVEEPCDDLIALESAAMLGQLSDGQRRCLDARVRTERLQTDKSKVSRLLIVNAQAAGERDAWMLLMERHLEDIDRSDPNLCFAYALVLHRTGDLDLAEEAVRWASHALENRQVWEGKEYVDRVTDLHRLRATASHKLWQNAEKAYRRETTGENEEMASTFRGWAKSYSREWLDYVRAAGKSSDKALQMCLSAAGAAAFCAEGAPR